MSLHLVTDSYDTLGNPGGYDRYLPLLENAVGDPAMVPLVLRDRTNGAISYILAELLLYLGRAQPTRPRKMRAPRRNESGRIAAALDEHKPTLVIFGAEYIQWRDVNLFANIANLAGTDLWFVPQQRCRASATDAFARQNVLHRTSEELLASQAASPTRGHRFEPTPCERALTSNGPEATCENHAHAGQCVTSSFQDAVLAARITPDAIRARLYDLTHCLSATDVWHVYAAARDPFQYVESLIYDLDISSYDARHLKIRHVNEDATTIRVGTKDVGIPEPRQPLLRRHRAIRIADGSPDSSPLLIPHDDRHRRVWDTATGLVLGR